MTCAIHRQPYQLFLMKRVTQKKQSDWWLLQPTPTGDGVTLPAGLQSLIFGDYFNKSMVNVTLPAVCRLFLPK